MSDVTTDLREMVALVTDRPMDAIDRADRFADLDDWSSLAALRLLSMIEQRLAVTLDLREYVNIETVGGLVDAVTAARASGQGSLR